MPKWLVFKEKDRKFEGTSINFDDVKIRLTATDSTGKSVSDEFIIFIVTSFTYVITVFVKYVSVLVSIMGLIKHRKDIYHIFCTKRYRYSNIE